MTAFFVPSRLSDLTSDSGDATVSVGTGGSGDLIFKTNSTERMRLTYAGLLSRGSGDNQTFNGLSVTSGAFANTTLGTAASPDSGLKPLAKYSRIFSHLSTDIASGDGAEQLAGISAMVQGDAANQVQSVGVYGGAYNLGTGVGASLSPDACGVYGFGRIGTGGVGVGMGGCFVGRADTTSSKFNCVQLLTYNASGVDRTYSSSALTDGGAWIQSLGGKNSGAAIIVHGDATNGKFDVGLGFHTQAVVTASIRDDSSSATSIVLNGTHSGYGIDFNGGTFTSGIFRIPNNVNVVGRNAAGSADVNLFKVSTGNALMFPSTLQYGEAVNVVLGTTTGTTIGTSTSQKLAFFNATAIVQPNATTDLGTVLSNLGLRASGTAYPITTSGAVALTGGLTANAITMSGGNIALGSNKITGSAAATANGDLVRYEQTYGAGAGDPLAVASGYINWNAPIHCFTNQSATTAGVVYATSIWLPPGKTITNVVLSCITGSAGTAPTNFYVGIAGPTGTMLAQSNDVKASVTGTGPLALALNATYTTSASDSSTGLYYIVVLQVGSWGTTQPQFARMANSAAPATALGANPRPFATGATAGQTALPANSSGIAGGLSTSNTPLAWFAGVN